MWSPRPARWSATAARSPAGAGSRWATPTEPGKAPFIAVTVFARGLLNRLFTRVYLPEDTEALANDPVLSALEPDRRKTLIAERLADGSLHWDIRLQGEDETVFLDFHGQA